MEQPLLEIHDLRTQFFTDDGLVRAVDGVSYTLGKGETVGVVGESGCAKASQRSQYSASFRIHRGKLLRDASSSKAPI